jgi:hypothetical protein
VPLPSCNVKLLLEGEEEIGSPQMPPFVEGMRTAYGRHDAVDVRRALLATMELFSWLGRETAQALGFTCPEAAETVVTALVHEVLPALETPA